MNSLRLFFAGKKSHHLTFWLSGLFAYSIAPFLSILVLRPFLKDFEFTVGGSHSPNITALDMSAFFGTWFIFSLILLYPVMKSCIAKGRSFSSIAYITISILFLLFLLSFSILLFCVHLHPLHSK